MSSEADILPHAVLLDGASQGAMQMIFAHGWGQSGAALRPLAESFASQHAVYLLDFPGFGAAATPPSDWGVADYAASAARYLESLKATHSAKPLIWVGHSFGGRVGMVLAATRPDLVQKLILIAGAGLPMPQPLIRRCWVWLKIRAFKLARFWAERRGQDLEALRQRFGSQDYRLAGHLRNILVRVVSEDLSPYARRISCPTLLLYGENDIDTPPQLGRKLAKLIPASTFFELEAFDHHSILSAGRHQLRHKMEAFLNV